MRTINAHKAKMLSNNIEFNMVMNRIYEAVKLGGDYIITGDLSPHTFIKLKGLGYSILERNLQPTKVSWK